MNRAKKRILVADDDPAILDVIVLILEDAGYEVRTASDGTILHDIQEIAPDLMLLDIRLSGWNGKEVCMALKSGEQTRHIPIVLISANKDTERMAQEAGADDFLTKPFEIEKMLHIVEHYLS